MKTIRKHGIGRIALVALVILALLSTTVIGVLAANECEHSFDSASGKCTSCTKSIAAASIIADGEENPHKYFLDVRNAINSASAGETVTVYKADELNGSQLVIPEGVTLTVDGKNTPVFRCLVVNRGTIKGGSFPAYTENCGTIDGGDFSGFVYNSAGATIKNGSFADVVSEGGKISGGKFSGVVSNGNAVIGGETVIGEISGGTFNKRVINNSGAKITDKIVEQTKADKVTKELVAPTFKGEVTNLGVIEGGKFGGKVSNAKATDEASSVTYIGSISGGLFNGEVTNDGEIRGGAFKKCGADIFDLKVGDYSFLDFADALAMGEKYTLGLFTKGEVKDGRTPLTFEKNVVLFGEVVIPDGYILSTGENVSVGVELPKDVTIDYPLVLSGDTDGAVGTVIAGGSYTLGIKVGAKDAIDGGSFSGKILNKGTVNDGSFTAEFTNEGVIVYGVFEGKVINKGVIGKPSVSTLSDEPEAPKLPIFKGIVTNEGTINNGSFDGEVENKEGGEILDGLFKNPVEGVTEALYEEIYYVTLDQAYAVAAADEGENKEIFLKLVIENLVEENYPAVVIRAEARIGNTYYPKLKKAAECAKSGDYIVLREIAVCDEEISLGEGVTLSAEARIGFTYYPTLVLALKNANGENKDTVSLLVPSASALEGGEEIPLAEGVTTDAEAKFEGIYYKAFLSAADVVAASSATEKTLTVVSAVSLTSGFTLPENTVLVATGMVVTIGGEFKIPGTSSVVGGTYVVSLLTNSGKFNCEMLSASGTDENTGNITNNGKILGGEFTASKVENNGEILDGSFKYAGTVHNNNGGIIKGGAFTKVVLYEGSKIDLREYDKKVEEFLVTGGDAATYSLYIPAAIDPETGEVIVPDNADEASIFLPIGIALIESVGSSNNKIYGIYVGQTAKIFPCDHQGKKLNYDKDESGYHWYDCEWCGLTEMDKTQHTMLDANCTEKRRCEICSYKVGDALGHSFERGKYDSYYTNCSEEKCSVCGATNDFYGDLYHQDVKYNAGQSFFLGYNSSNMTFDKYEVGAFFSSFVSKVALYEVLIEDDTVSFLAVSAPESGKAYKLAYVDTFGKAVYFTGNILNGVLEATEDLNAACDIYVTKGAMGYALEVDTYCDGVKDGYLTFETDLAGSFYFWLREAIDPENVEYYAFDDVSSSSFFAYEDGKLAVTVSKYFSDNKCDICDAELPWLSDGEASTIAIVASIVALLLIIFILIYFGVKRRSVGDLFRSFRHY